MITLIRKYCAALATIQTTQAIKRLV